MTDENDENNDQNNSGYDMIFKIIILGDASVGKTNIVSKYLRDEFDQDTKSTVGAVFNAKNLEIENTKIKLQIWDTAGQEVYKSIVSSYYKGAKGAILVYDITRKTSFENIDKWIPDLKANADIDLIMILIGNKSDLEEQREVTEEEGKQKAENYKMAFMETSAKNGSNIEKAFQELVESLYKDNYDKIIKNPNVKVLGEGNDIGNNEDKKNEKKCC